jgi:hypothetical protein
MKLFISIFLLIMLFSASDSRFVKIVAITKKVECEESDTQECYHGFENEVESMFMSLLVKKRPLDFVRLHFSITFTVFV